MRDWFDEPRDLSFSIHDGRGLSFSGKDAGELTRNLGKPISLISTIV